MQVYIRIEVLRFYLRIGRTLSNEIIKVKAETPKPPQPILLMMNLVSKPLLIYFLIMI